MPLYRVLLRGENFMLNLTGEPELLGFHATYYVRAATEQDAERIAMISIHKNRQLKSGLVILSENPNRVVCESIKRVWWRSARDDGRYRFWSMDNAGADPSATP
jgi:hypothetical protein